ncbi:MAG: hypothetical protein U0V73_11870 [Acidimicrobiia bacterium]
MARKGRARRFREARELKQRDDGLFREGSGTLADAEDAATHLHDDEFDEEDEFASEDEDDPWADLQVENE